MDYRLSYLQALGITLYQRRAGGLIQWKKTVLEHPKAPETVPETVPETALEAAAEEELAMAPPPLDWQKLKQQVEECTACSLHQSRTQTVFGVGDSQADLMIIGEAPGADEDRLGEPFVGRAGQLLNQMLAAIHLQRHQVYIANVLKCRPPNNRNPHLEEIASCQHFLAQQISLIQPKLILILGRIAAHHLLHTQQSLAKLRGQVYHYRDLNGDLIPVMVSYHPAYLLRNSAEKAKSWQDLQQVYYFLQEKSNGDSTED